MEKESSNVSAEDEDMEIEDEEEGQHLDPAFLPLLPLYLFLGLTGLSPRRTRFSFSSLVISRAAACTACMGFFVRRMVGCCLLVCLLCLWGGGGVRESNVFFRSAWLPQSHPEDGLGHNCCGAVCVLKMGLVCHPPVPGAGTREEGRCTAEKGGVDFGGGGEARSTQGPSTTKKKAWYVARPPRACSGAACGPVGVEGSCILRAGGGVGVWGVGAERALQGVARPQGGGGMGRHTRRQGPGHHTTPSSPVVG